MNRLGPSRRLCSIGVLMVLYFVAGKLGLMLATVHASITAVWPPTGIALAALLILDYDVWPGIFLGALLVNLTTAGSTLTCIGIATGNTLEAVVGAYLINRFANGRHAFDRTPDIIKFTLLATILSTMVSATVGVTSLSVGGFAPWANYRVLWLTWWQGDAAGALLVTPFLLLWSARPRVRWNWDQIAEATALLTLLIAVGATIFGGLFSSEIRNAPTEYLCIPFLIWVAFRFGPREASTSILILAGIAIRGTMEGNGPFASHSQNASLLLLQTFMGVVAITTLVLAAEVVERRNSAEKLQQMALSDPLTGLANYRRLVDALDAEMRRTGRTGRAFSILVLDLDGLKKINDLHGHVVGSRALCRVANILRAHCRATDLAARYGGDEFVIVLPESDEEGTIQAAHRIMEKVARDDEQPLISVSVGTAIYPRDGETISGLLSAADAALYAKKREKALALRE